MASHLRSFAAQVHRRVRSIGSPVSFTDFMRVWVSSMKYGFAVYAGSQIFNVAKEYPKTVKAWEVSEAARQRYLKMVLNKKA